MCHLIKNSKKFKNFTALFLSYLMFQFSFIGCADVDETAEPFLQNQAEYSLTTQDLELINFISERHENALSKSLAISKDLASFEKNFSKLLTEESTISSQKGEIILRISNFQGIETIFSDWQLKISNFIDHAENNRNSIFHQIELVQRQTHSQIMRSRLSVDEKRMTQIFIDSYTNVLKTTVNEYLRNGGKVQNLFLSEKCNFWKKLKWIIKCTALTIKAGVDCVAAANDLDWGKGSKCVLAGIAAIDCWAGGCK